MCLDTLLCHGDHKRDQQGFVQKVDGAQEAIQRAMIRLSVPKGSFVPDPNLGSRLFLLGQSPVEQTEELALEYAKEALLDEKEVQAVSVKKISKTGEGLELEFELEYLGKDAFERFGVMWELNF